MTIRKSGGRGGAGPSAGIPSQDHIFGSVAERDTFFTNNPGDLATGIPIFVADGSSTFLEVWGGMAQASYNPATDAANWVRGGSVGLTAAQIKNLYESNPNTNAFTDAFNTLLGLITATQPIDLDGLADSSLNWIFSDSTDGTNPGANNLALNNPVKDNATAINFNVISSVGSARFDEFLVNQQQGGFIFLRERAEANTSILYQISGSTTLDGTRVDVPVTRMRDQGGEFTDGSIIDVHFIGMSTILTTLIGLNSGVIPIRTATGFGPSALTETDTEIISTKPLQVPAGSLSLGGSQILSSGDRFVTFRDGRGNQAYAIGISFDSSGSQAPSFFRLDQETSGLAADVRDTQLSGIQSFGVTSTLNTLSTGISLLPATTGTLTVVGYVGTDNSGAEIFRQSYPVTQADVDNANLPTPAYTPFRTENPTFNLVNDQVFIELSGVDLFGGTQTEPRFLNEVIPSFQALVQLANSVDYITDDNLATKLASTESTEAIQDIVGAMVSGNTETGITVAYDDTDGKLNFFVGSAPTGTETFYHGLSDSDNPGSVALSTLTAETVNTGSGQQFNFSVGPATVNQYVIILAPSDHDLTALTNTGSGFEVLASYTRTINVRTEGGVTYHAYTRGPLVDGFTASYRATLA